MHHELLLALSGCPGNVFITSRETGLYELIPDLPFIHPSEVAIVNKVVCLGSYYKTLSDFITRQLYSVVALVAPPTAAPAAGDQKPSTDNQGLYLRALAFGIDDVLDPYRQRLVDVEKQCVADPCLPLSHIQCQFEEFQVLFSSLEATVKTVEQNKIHGCCILTYIYEKCQCGIPHVKEAYERILNTVCQVFYKQLSMWISHGLLKDNFNEFFINRVAKSSEGGGSSEGRDKKESVYQILSTRKPSFIPLRVAEKILFIGEAVRVFYSCENAQNVVDKNASQAASRLLADQLQFTHLLSELQEQKVFNLRTFESVCSRVRDTVAEHLWKLIVEEADLLGSLQLLKEFFLLGRGELFLTFIDMANSFMGLPPTATSEHDVNIAFSQTMVKMGFESDSLLRHFKFNLPAVKTSKKVLGQHPQPSSAATASGAGGDEIRGEKAWNVLGLSYKPQWPLHVFFTPTVLEKYNSLFKFLLAMKRAQVDLHKSWYLQTSRRQRCQGVWQLRLHMAFILDNLQYYVQVDVLETQFALLVEKINSSHDFEFINHAHEQFLTTLQAQLFFKTKPVFHSIHEILELCHRYYSFVKSMGNPLSAQEVTIVERLAKEFQRQSALLFRILKGVKSLHASPHLSQLLLRVDYNKYFSSKMATLASTVSSTINTASQQSQS